MEYFIFNGIKSTDMNIVIKNLPPITRASQRINTIQLEGRGGTLHEIEDKFDSYNIQIECILMPSADINKIKQWLIGQSGLILSSTPNIMHVATVVNKIDFTKYLTFLREFPLELEIQPISYSLNETRHNFDKNMNKCLQNVNIYGYLNQKNSVQGKNICPTDFNEWESGHYGTTGVKEDNVARIRLKKLLKVEPNNTYYLSTNFENYLFVIRTYDSTGTFVASIGAVQNGNSFTTGATVNYLSIAIYKAGANMNDETYDKFKSYFENGSLKPFICLNSVTDKTYEEFSPNSPSPDYPSEVQVVGDNVNLFNKSAITENVGISYDTGAEYSNTTIFSTDYILIKSIKDLVWNGSSNATHTWGALYDENKTYLQGVNVTNKKVIITNSDAKYIRLTFLNEYLDTLKIEKGTVQTGYTSYGVGGIDYKTVNKNLFNKNRAVKGFYYNSKGELATSENWYYENIKVATNTTYVISGKILDNTSAQFVEFDENFNFINCIGNYKATSVFTTTDKTAYVGLSIPYYDGTSNDLNTLQLEKSTVATDYVENQEKDIVIELPQGEFMAKIGDYEDYINNKGVLHKYIGKVVLNGSENIIKADFGTNLYRISVDTLLNNSEHNKIKVKSSHFLSVSYTDRAVEKSNIIYLETKYINIRNTEFTTVEAFKTWLSEQYASGTPVEIYYVLATPYTVSLADEQKEKYLSLPLYEGINNIETSAEISFEAYTTLEDKISFTRLKEISFERISQPNIITINSTYKTYPLLKVIGNGSITCNNRTITIVNNDDYLYIDCELQNAYKDEENKNNCVNGLEEPIYLDCGENEIELIGIYVELIYKEAWL